MQEDPILAELRALREEYAASFDHDPKAIYEDLLGIQAEHPGELVRYPPRKPQARTANAATKSTKAEAE